MPASRPRLELVWPGKDQFLLTPSGPEGRPVWVEPDHPAAHEVRLAEFTAAYGQVDDADPYGDNLVFTGDSLDVLRVLCEVPEYRQDYRGKVRQIYIDPPFNTGVTFQHYDDWMEHSTWLSFMRDRLILARDLLATDGTLWVHLDDAEVHRMRSVLDEVFGAGNYRGTVIWEKTDSPRMDAQGFSTRHDTILVYGVSPAARIRPLPTTRSHANRTADDGRRYYLNPLRARGGQGSTREARPNLYFAMIAPDGTAVYPKLPSGGDGAWRWSQAKVEAEADRLEWVNGRNGWNPYYRIYEDADATIPPQTLWPYEEVGSTRNSAKEIKDLLNGTAFSTPKPERLLQRIMQIGSDPGDIVLDVFGGSGTTAAVAQKMGRRWVTAELSPDTVAKFIVPRLTKVVGGQDPGGITKAVGWEGGGGFRTVTVGPSMYEVTPVGVMLADWATNGKFARAVAGQLGFTFQPDAAPLCGVRGRMRLAVLDGAVGPEEVREIVAALGDSERVTIVAKVILPGAEEALAEMSRGSKIRKAPRDLLTDDIRRAKRRRRSQTGDTG